MVAEGLKSLLSTEFELLDVVEDGRALIAAAKQLRPDVIVADITMPRLNGLEAARVIRKEVPHTQILILSQHDTEEMSSTALEAGARGYVSKSDVANTLFASMLAILHAEEE